MTDLLPGLTALLLFPGLLFLIFSGLIVQWLDRRLVAMLQHRVGPPWYQPLADIIKLLAKEDILPIGASEWVVAVLPMLSMAAVLTSALYVPIAGPPAARFEGDLIVVLFLLSLPPLAQFLASWHSVGVYSIIGGSRALLQYFAYEVPFLVALISPAIWSSSWSIAAIVEQQAESVWAALVQPVGFLLAIVGLVGKLKRVPFDIPKAKTEIVAGALTEFSGRKLALWHLTLDIQTVVGIFLLANVFLGGGDPSPFTTLGAQGAASLWSVGLVHVLAFAAKALLLLVTLSVIKVLYARLRIDQLAQLGWRILAPLALLQMLVAVWMGIS